MKPLLIEFKLHKCVNHGSSKKSYTNFPHLNYLLVIPKPYI